MTAEGKYLKIGKFPEMAKSKVLYLLWFNLVSLRCRQQLKGEIQPIERLVTADATIQQVD